MMKILVVSSYLPYPLFSGGHIRLFNLLKELSKKHQITLVCEQRDYQKQKDIDVVNQFCQKIITVPRKKQWSISNIVKSGFSNYPFLMVGHTNEDLKTRIIKELSEEKFDLIHVETFYVMQNLPRTEMVRGLPIILGEQNIEHLVYKRFADQANFLLRPLLLFDVLKIKYWEEKFWKEASHVVVTSENEKREVEKYNSNVTVVPNGVDLTRFRVQGSRQRRGSPRAAGFRVNKKGKTILFIGDFRWIENRDAAKWLLSAIWPKIRNSKFEIRNSLKLWIVGKKIPDSIKRLGDKTVVFDEHAPDDTTLIYNKADLLLTPIRVGGGGKFKILESMASGIPVVTTSIGIEGIEAKKQEEVLIGDSTQRLVNKTIEVLRNQDLYEKLVRQARLLIEEKYDWRRIIRYLEGAYESVFKTVNV